MCISCLLTGKEERSELANFRIQEWNKNDQQSSRTIWTVAYSECFTSNWRWATAPPQRVSSAGCTNIQLNQSQPCWHHCGLEVMTFKHSHLWNEENWLFDVLGDKGSVRKINCDALGTGKVFFRELLNTGFSKLSCKEYKVLLCLWALALLMTLLNSTAVMQKNPRKIAMK